MRRLVMLGLILGVLAGSVAGIGLLAAPPAAATPIPETAVPAGPGGRTRPGQVNVVKVSGLLDPVLVDFVERSVRQAEDQHVVALVLQMNSSGSVVSDHRIAQLARRLHDAAVRVAIWVGPSGAKATGAAAQLLGVVPEVGVAPGSHVGDTGDLAIDRSLLRPAFRTELARLHDHRLDWRDARRTRIATVNAPVLGELVVNTPGVPTRTIKTSEGPRRQPRTDQVFSQLPVTSQLMHTVASTSVAYLLFVAGMALIVLELYTAGIGLAGLVGAGCFMLGCYGLAVLPATPFGVALLVASMVAFAIDVQTGTPRAWTGIGVAAFVVGSLNLYDGFRVPWLTFGVVVLAVIVFMVSALPALIRTRFSTPTIGREWMIGEQGEALADVAPEGIVRLRDAQWRAYANRATPIKAGQPVEVLAVDGLLLRVGPVGAAQAEAEAARRHGARFDDRQPASLPAEAREPHRPGSDG